MVDDTQERSRQMLRDALDHLQSGLDLLDRAGAPGQIGAHVDLAINQLGNALASDLADRLEPDKNQENTAPILID
jgi:hypothetical protein